MNKDELCPCGAGKTYANCCGVFIAHLKNPATPEELMRSRYTAFYQVNTDYLADTMKSPAADNFNAEETRAWAEKITWVKLIVVKSSQDETKGFVEFYAHYLLDNKKHVMHEKSKFACVDGKWFYVDGVQPTNKKIIRKG